MRDVLRLSVPLGLWLAGFSALYGLQGLTCSRHWPEGWADRPALVAAWALAVGVQGAALLALHRAPSPSRGVQALALGLGATALLAATWTGAPVALIPNCG